MENTLVNKVEESGILTFNLEDYFPQAEIKSFDLAPFLFQGLILREKDYRAALKEFDFSGYSGTWTHVYCSADAIIPHWAFMLAASYLSGISTAVFFGTKEEMLSSYYHEVLGKLDWQAYADQRVVVKGCGDKEVPVGAYLSVTNHLREVAKSIFYGEPCSTVPVWKRKGNNL